MASTGERIPAWRKLGLALKHENQSGVAVNEPNTIHNSEPNQLTALSTSTTSHDDLQSPVKPTVNGKSSKLGKRKHQTEPAEDQGQNTKKYKTADTESEFHGNAAYDTFDPTQVDSVETDHATAQSASIEATQPKGDPNYRKKKTKPARRRREDHADHAPALSPDDLSLTRERPALFASTELGHTDSAQFATPQKPSKFTKAKTKDTSGSPPQSDRRKSVAFTPDTKTADGNSGQELFKKWVAEQKGTGAVSAPPEVSNFTLHSLIAEEEKAARKNGQLDKPQKTPPVSTEKSEDTIQQDLAESINSQSASTNGTEDPASTAIRTNPDATVRKGKKKDPSVYLAYLAQYHTDRDHWKFNKAKQNDVVDNALNIFRIPEEHSEALLQYVSGLQGAGVIDRLQERCHAALKELDEQDADMDDAEARKVIEEEAEQDRIAKERKRRKVEGDVEAFVNHPHSDGYIRRLRRARAKALLTALGRTAPIMPANTESSGINPLMKSIAPPQRDSKKRKRRVEVSSDESSSDSSSDEDSSSSEAESDESNDSSSSSDESDNGSDDDGTSDSDADSE